MTTAGHMQPVNATTRGAEAVFPGVTEIGPTVAVLGEEAVQSEVVAFRP